MLYQVIKKCGLAVLLLSLYANNAHAQVDVFACEPEWAALARALGGDALTVYSATTAQQDPHHIQARPSLIAKVRRADLIICTGAELEIGWLPLLLRKAGNSAIQINQPGHFMAADHVELLEKPTVLDRSLGDLHAAGNPHVHLDPHRVRQIAAALTSTLSTVDPANSPHYQSRLEHFNREWDQAIVQWQEQTRGLRGKSIIVSHNNWVYLEQWLDLKKVATLEPKPGIPPTSGHLAKVLAQLQRQPAEMIIYAANQNDKPARWLTKKTGMPSIALPLSPDNDESLIQWFNRLLEHLQATGQ